jgi:hypothetical protein
MELFLFALFCLSVLHLLHDLQQDLHMYICFCFGVSVHGCVTWILVKLGTKKFSVSELISCMLTLNRACQKMSCRLQSLACFLLHYNVCSFFVG